MTTEKYLNVTTLNNGLKIGIMEMPEVQSVCVHLRGKAGSNCEENSSLGCAHVAEHVKIAQSLGTYEFSSLGKNGAKYMGVTSRDDVLFGIKCLAPFFEQAIKVIEKLLTNSQSSIALLEANKSLAIQEIQKFCDSPEELIKRTGYRGLFPNTRMAMFNTGSIDDVRSITPQSLDTFISRNYIPSNFVVCICGNISAQKAIDSITRSISTNSTQSAQPVPADTSLQENDLQIVDVEILGSTTLDYARLTFYGYAINDDRKYAQVVLARVVDLYVKEALKSRGISYKTAVSSYSSASYGIFDIGFSNSPKDTLSTLDIVKTIWQSIPRIITEETLEIAKNCIYSTFVFELEKISSRTAYYSELLLHGRSDQNFTYEISQIINCTCDEVIREWEYISSQKPKISVVGGNFGEKEKKYLKNFRLS